MKTNSLLFTSVLIPLIIGFYKPQMESYYNSYVNHVDLPIYYENKAIVLMYHHLDDEEQTSATISPEKFDQHIQMLIEEGYHIINMQQFLKFMKENASIPPNAVLITFDDGYESFYTEAFPILQKHGVVASHFIIGVSSDVVNPLAFPHLTWDQMRTLKEAGMSFYSHTYDSHSYVPVNEAGETRPKLTHRQYLFEEQRVETLDEYRSRVRQDLAYMEQRLQEELGGQEKLLAFPYGAYNEDVLEIGADLGIELFFTTQPGINGSGSLLVYRLNAGSPHIDADRLKNELRKYHEP